MVTHIGECGRSAYGDGVYLGTVWDANLIAAPFSAGGSENWGAFPIGLIDLPFSLAADTIFLPFDIVGTSNRKKSENGSPLQPDPQADWGPAASRSSTR